MSRINVVRGRFAATRVRINVRRYESRRMDLYEASSVFRFADRFVAARKVDDNISPRERVRRGRRSDRPQIFAYFRRDRKILLRPLAENYLPAERYGIAEKTYRLVLFGTGCEIAFFVKFVIVREIGFGNKPQHLAAADCRRDVIYKVVFLKRQAHEHKHALARRIIDDRFKPRERRA